MTQFKYPIPDQPTLKVQFAIDDSEFVELGTHTLGRGEVLAVKSAERARQIVRHPKFAYAPDDAPVGLQKSPAPGDVLLPASARPGVSVEDHARAMGIPLVITAEMRKELGARGLGDAEIDALTPQQARDILNRKAE